MSAAYLTRIFDRNSWKIDDGISSADISRWPPNSTWTLSSINHHTLINEKLFFKNENTYSVISVVFDVVPPTNFKKRFLLAVEFPKWSSAKRFIQELSPLQDAILSINVFTVLFAFSNFSLNLEWSFHVMPFAAVPIKNIMLFKTNWTKFEFYHWNLVKAFLREGFYLLIIWL